MHGAAQMDEEHDDTAFEEMEEFDEFEVDDLDDVDGAGALGPEPLGDDGPNTREAFEDQDDELLFDE